MVEKEKDMLDPQMTRCTTSEGACGPSPGTTSGGNAGGVGRTRVAWKRGQPVEATPNRPTKASKWSEAVRQAVVCRGSGRWRAPG